jgi:hypothetical protein
VLFNTLFLFPHTHVYTIINPCHNQNMHANCFFLTNRFHFKQTSYSSRMNMDVTVSCPNYFFSSSILVIHVSHTCCQAAHKKFVTPTFKQREEAKTVKIIIQKITHNWQLMYDI